MTTRDLTRKATLSAFLAAAFLVVAASPAFAGLVTDTVGSVESAVENTAKETSSGGSQLTQQTGSEDLVEEVVKKVDETGNAVTKTAEETEETIEEASKGAGEKVNETGSYVEQTVNEIAVENPLGEMRGNKGKKGAGSSGHVGTATRNGSDPSALDLAAFAERNRPQSTPVGAFDSRARLASDSPVILGQPSDSGSIFSQFAEAAAEAARKLGFPLALTLMVVAFLVVQGRFDRKDAKLVLAPIDSEQELLSFQ